MASLDEQLDDFVGEKVDPDTGEITPPQRRTRSDKGRPRTKHVGAFDTGQPLPGEEPARAGAPHVYAAISAVTAGLAQTGIGKGRRNTQQGYNFRGIDDVYNALAGLLVAHRLVILPHVEERTVTERAARGGGMLNYVTVLMNFDLISVVDGSRERVSSFGEAMDSGDKATNKALSTAYKYMAMQVFCIPTIGIDPEEDTYELVNPPEQPKEAGPVEIHAPQRRRTAANSKLEPPISPSPEHVKLVLSEAQKMAQLPREEAIEWFNRQLPEDRAILTAAKARRSRYSLG